MDAISTKMEIWSATFLPAQACGIPQNLFVRRVFDEQWWFQDFHLECVRAHIDTNGFISGRVRAI